ncbi:MAG TPA: nucleotidyltransferase domain-containing protein [Ignavibacteria bacterium]|nr:nucleotidyltransferase domain-containing protein [Ignavibacteria bacterium]HAX49082.1 nucleotidyltransferase [Bacteroidota bacterium]HRE10383.1 nucleotidyltransferase domain-containing protein [Ignavibacteria bacterium]HRF65046.1 nucleotidyltransferase domain-containing protein [Ignavibacteria bacterium]HRJ05542.1 nucleotidyltransferase domain-containing protein [Ignavibacteria bacterium]
MDKKYALNIAKRFSAEIKNIISAENVILFGSYAKGNYHKWSDIDIAIIVKNSNFDYFDIYKKLGAITLKLDTRIEPIIMDRTKDYSGFIESIKKEGIVIRS